MILQTLFLIYSLFSVDAFTIKVCNLVGKDPPDGLPDVFRAVLLAMCIVNGVSAGIAELVSVLLLRLIDKVRRSTWFQNCWGRKHDPVLQQGLLSTPSVGHDSQWLSGKGHTPAAVHIPALQAPSGAALL